MDLRHIRHFTAVYDAGGFARAAEHCHVSQPSISASISQLEAELRVKLFDRGGFGARPTLFAHRLHQHAKLVLSEMRRAGDEIAALREGEGGSVSIGIGPLFEHTIMPSVLAAFVVKRPRVSVSTAEGLTTELYDRLARGELDFVVSTPPGWIEASRELKVEVLDETHDVIVAAAEHPLWTRDDFSLEALSRFPWVVSARVGEAARSFFLSFAQAGLDPPKSVVRTDSIAILRELVVRNAFLCVVSPQFAEPLVGSGPEKLRILPQQHFGFPRRMCLATRSDSVLGPAAAELCTEVREACLAIKGEI
jgi:DNA-binding transcriptional LysR family regulator